MIEVDFLWDIGVLGHQIDNIFCNFFGSKSLLKGNAEEVEINTSKSVRYILFKGFAVNWILQMLLENGILVLLHDNSSVTMHISNWNIYEGNNIDEGLICIHLQCHLKDFL